MSDTDYSLRWAFAFFLGGGILATPAVLWTFRCYQNNHTLWFYSVGAVLWVFALIGAFVSFIGYIGIREESSKK